MPYRRKNIPIRDGSPYVPWMSQLLSRELILLFSLVDETSERAHILHRKPLPGVCPRRPPLGVPGPSTSVSPDAPMSSTSPPCRPRGGVHARRRRRGARRGVQEEGREDRAAAARPPVAQGGRG